MSASKLYVYNVNTGLVLAVVTGNQDAAQIAAEKFINDKEIDCMFYKLYGYPEDSNEGKAAIRYAKNNGLVEPIGIRDGKFNSYVARHCLCVEINLI